MKHLRIAIRKHCIAQTLRIRGNSVRAYSENCFVMRSVWLSECLYTKVFKYYLNMYFEHLITALVLRLCVCVCACVRPQKEYEKKGQHSYKFRRGCLHNCKEKKLEDGSYKLCCTGHLCNGSFSSSYVVKDQRWLLTVGCLVSIVASLLRLVWTAPSLGRSNR